MLYIHATYCYLLYIVNFDWQNKYTPSTIGHSVEWFWVKSSAKGLAADIGTIILNNNLWNSARLWAILLYWKADFEEIRAVQTSLELGLIMPDMEKEAAVPKWGDSNKLQEIINQVNDDSHN